MGVEQVFRCSFNSVVWFSCFENYVTARLAWFIYVGIKIYVVLFWIMTIQGRTTVWILWSYQSAWAWATLRKTSLELMLFLWLVQWSGICCLFLYAGPVFWSTYFMSRKQILSCPAGPTSLVTIVSLRFTKTVLIFPLCYGLFHSIRLLLVSSKMSYMPTLD